jgi:TPR repeat protein
MTTYSPHSLLHPSAHSAFFPPRRIVTGIGLCLLLVLSACTTVPVEPQQRSTSAAQLEQQQQRFAQGKKLFLNKQYAEAASILLPLAQQGHLDAQYTVGYMYHYGYGLPRNEKESTHWITMAAARGHALAKEALARINALHDQNGVVSEPSAPSAAPAIKP